MLLCFPSASLMSDNDRMRLVFDMIGEICSRKPGALSERLTPWVFLILGGGLVLLMVYSCATAPR